MKKETLWFAALFIFVVLVLNVSNAYATMDSPGAFSQSEATMDWTSLSISGGITWVSNSQNSSSHAYAENDTEHAEDSDSSPGWVGTNADAFLDTINGQSWTNNESALYAKVSAVTDGTSTMSGYADANAMYSGTFTATSDGYVNISINYDLSQQLQTGMTGNDAEGLTYAGLLLHNLWNVTPATDFASISTSISDGATFTDSQSGTLTVSVWFDELDEGSFRAWVYNQATIVVPEPATIALLGLGALSLTRRNRKV